MTTVSMNDSVNYASPHTGCHAIAITISHRPKDDVDFPFEHERVRIIPEKSSSVSDAGVVGTHYGGIITQAPASEMTRPQMLYHYLVSVRDAGDIDAKTASLAWIAWKRISDAMGEPLLVPDAASGPEGQLLYAWNQGEHHLELEIFPAEPAEFFYLNRSSNETWEEEYTVGNPVSQEAKARLNVFM